MHPTARCLSKGFVSRSLDEFKRLSSFAFSLDGIKGPSGPMPLHSFDSPASLEECKLMSDADMGGYSTASLDWQPPTAFSSSTTSSSSIPSPQTHTSAPDATATTTATTAAATAATATRTTPPHARFHGTISTALPERRPEIQRSGYAAFRTLDRPPTLFGRSLWNIDMYAYLALRVKTDGRAYFVNVQTESVVPTDLHQHRLFSRRPGEWETVLIKWNDFVRTNHGFVVEPQTEMLRQKVRSLGIGLTDRVPGPFELCIERMWATNDLSEADDPDHTHAASAAAAAADAAAAEARQGQLRNKQGKNISWSDR